MKISHPRRYAVCQLEVILKNLRSTCRYFYPLHTSTNENVCVLLRQTKIPNIVPFCQQHRLQRALRQTTTFFPTLSTLEPTPFSVKKETWEETCISFFVYFNSTRINEQ